MDREREREQGESEGYPAGLRSRRKKNVRKRAREHLCLTSHPLHYNHYTYHSLPLRGDVLFR